MLLAAVGKTAEPGQGIGGRASESGEAELKAWPKKR